jgi:hypothetical protein
MAFPGSRQTMINVLTLIISAAWMVAFIARLFNDDAMAPTGLDGIMVTVVTYFFTAKAVNGGGI